MLLLLFVVVKKVIFLPGGVGEVGDGGVVVRPERKGITYRVLH